LRGIARFLRELGQAESNVLARLEPVAGERAIYENRHARLFGHPVTAQREHKVDEVPATLGRRRGPSEGRKAKGAADA
jgi:hypothetical protein